MNFKLEIYGWSDCNGDGCDWDIDHEQILCDYFGVEKLKEID